MIVLREPNYIVAGNLASDIVGPWIHCSTAELIVIQLESAITVPGNNTSLVRVEGTNDPSQAQSSIIGNMGLATTTLALVELQSTTVTPGWLPEWVRFAWRHDASDPVQGTLRVRVIGRG